MKQCFYYTNKQIKYHTNATVHYIKSGSATLESVFTPHFAPTVTKSLGTLLIRQERRFFNENFIGYARKWFNYLSQTQIFMNYLSHALLVFT